jgi:adenylylsulfate kinase-like enzyme
VIWLTGLSGAGKSTLAAQLHAALRARGRLAAVIDGDELRRGLSRDLGFGPADRA